MLDALTSEYQGAARAASTRQTLRAGARLVVVGGDDLAGAREHGAGDVDGAPRVDAPQMARRQLPHLPMRIIISQLRMWSKRGHAMPSGHPQTVSCNAHAST